MTLFATSLLFIVYNYCVFFYFAKIFGTKPVKPVTLLILSFINSFIVYYPVYISKFQYEGIFMIIYFLVIGCEILLIFKQSITKTISALLCFTINFFGVRVLIIGLIAQTSNLPISDILNNLDDRLYISSLTFLILSPYIFVSSKILLSRTVKYLLSDLHSLKLACLLLGAVCFYQFFSLPTLYVDGEFYLFNSAFQIRIGIISLLCFVIIMSAVFMYSRLRKSALEYKSTSIEMRTDTLTIEKLQAEAKTDFFTGFWVRSIANEKINEFLELKSYAYILYLDIDRLKYVNDTYGHEEGDWYILSVCDCIRETFSSDIIARVGGDEFLIVGNSVEISINEKINSCYEKVLALKTINNKPYETSISYGLTTADETNTLSLEQLIENTDNKMYLFKKSRNKQRE